MSDAFSEIIEILHIDQRQPDSQTVVAAITDLQRSDTNLESLYEMIGISAEDHGEAFSEFKEWVANQFEQMNNGLFIKYEDYDHYQQLKKNEASRFPEMEAAPSQPTVEELFSRVSGICKTLSLPELTLSESLAEIETFAEEYAEESGNGQFIEFDEYETLLNAEKELMEAQNAQETEEDNTKQLESVIETLHQRIKELETEIESESVEASKYSILLSRMQVDSENELMLFVENLQLENAATKERLSEQLDETQKISESMKRMRLLNQKLMRVLQVHQESDLLQAATQAIEKISQLIKENSALKRSESGLLEVEEQIMKHVGLSDTENLPEQLEKLVDRLKAKITHQIISLREHAAIEESLREQLAKMELLLVERDETLISSKRLNDTILQKMEGEIDAKKHEIVDLRKRMRLEQVRFQSSISEFHDLAIRLKAFKSETVELKFALLEAQEALFDEEEISFDAAFAALQSQIGNITQELKEKEVIEFELTEKQISYQELVNALASEKEQSGHLSLKKNEVQELLAERELELAEKEAEIEELQDRIAAEAEKEVEYQQRINVMEDTISGLQNTLTGEEADFELARRQIIDTEQMIQMNKKLQEEKVELEKQVSIMQEELAKTEKSCHNQAEEFSRMQELIDAAQQSNEKIVYDLRRTAQVCEEPAVADDSLDRLCDHFRIPRTEVYEYIQGFMQTIERQKKQLIEERSHEQEATTKLQELEQSNIELKDKLEKIIAKDIIPQPEVHAMKRRLQSEIAELDSELASLRSENEAIKQQSTQEIEKLQLTMVRLEKELAMRRSANFRELKVENTAIETDDEAHEIDLVAVFDLENQLPHKATQRTRFCRKMLDRVADEKIAGKERIESFELLLEAIKLSAEASSKSLRLSSLKE